MAEEEKDLEKKEEEKEEDPTEDESGSSKEKAGELITKANDAAERLEKANKEHDRLIKIQEKIKVEQTLGGTTEAGQPAQTEEQKGIESAKKLLKGTGFEEMLDPEKPKPL